jgi:sugar phosphate permease
MAKLSRTFWNIWSSYAIFYFGKVNLSIVVPVLLATYHDLSLYNVGLVSSGFMATYAIGQFLHGQISQRYNPFTYIALGLLGSAAVNLSLGFSAGFFWVLMIGEMLDGGFQSMGWSSCVRANAETSKNIDRDSTVLGTAYQFGNSFAWIICAFVVGWFGWQYGFWVASAVMCIRGISLLLIKPEIKVKRREIGEQVKLTLSRPIVISGISLCLLNIARYGVITWIPTFLYATQGMAIGKVGTTIFLIPIAGIIGTLLFNKIRLPKDIISVAYLICLALTFIIFPGTTGTFMFVLLILSGFFLYGPHVFLVTTFPSRFHEQKVVAAATGFIDGMGYVGAVLVGILVPFIIDKSGGDWTSVFYSWAAACFAIIVLVTVVYLKDFRKPGTTLMGE